MAFIHRILRKYPGFPRKTQTASLATILSVVYGYHRNTQYEKNKTKLDIIIQDGNSSPKSSAFIRLIGPLTHSYLAGRVSLNICQDSSEIRVDTNVVIVQRTAVGTKKEAQKLLSLAKNRKIKLIVDTDDAFFDLEKKHPNYKTHRTKHDALLSLVKNADQIWVSTANLKKYYQPLTKASVQIVPNTLDYRVWKKNKPKNPPPDAPLKILYMGTATHSEDLKMITPWLDQTNNENPGSFEVFVIGIASSLPEKSWLKPLKRAPNSTIYPNFAKWIQKEGPFDLGIAPLLESRFNKYKSDIKCLDYIAVGAVPMVSDLDPYEKSDLDSFIIRSANTRNGWVKSIEKILIDLSGFRQKRLSILRRGQDYLWRERSSEVAAKKIGSLLEIT